MNGMVFVNLKMSAQDCWWLDTDFLHNQIH